MNNGKPLLTVENLCAGYNGARILENVSFTLHEKEIICIVGISGSGKSTLLKAIMGTFPGTEIYSGDIRLSGVSLPSLPARQLTGFTTEHIGMVFQSPGASFNPIRSYRQQFAETLKSHGRYNPETFFAQVDETFGRLGLTDTRRILSLCPYEMSGGMNQRIAIALALLMKQEILLSDEPTSALDATIQLQVAKELKNLPEKSGISQIIVTHNLALARFLADKVYIMREGKLTLAPETEEVVL